MRIAIWISVAALVVVTAFKVHHWRGVVVSNDSRIALLVKPKHPESEWRNRMEGRLALESATRRIDAAVGR